MTHIHYKQRTKSNYIPANWNANEIVGVITVGVSDVVVGAFVNVRAVFDGTTVKAELGDGTDKKGFIADAESAVDTGTGVKMGAGNYFAAAPGKLYTAADKVDINYTIGGTDSTDIGRSDWWIWFTRVSPH